MTLRTRIAEPADAPAITETIDGGFAGYRAWAPAGWAPPDASAERLERLAGALARDDVWCLLALDGDAVAGHAALAPTTIEDPAPAPPGVVNLWQLFVRPAWQGRGVSRELMAAAVAEARVRGFTRMRLWTPQGAGRARRFYEREGWTATGGVHANSPSGLVTVEYGRGL